MQRHVARKIAETITNEQIKKMFEAAKAGIKDWTKTSSCNKGMTKGVAWNILAKNFDLKTEYSVLAKTNMVQEFGDFLSYKLKPEKKQKPAPGKVAHQEPDFSNYE